MNRDRAFFQRAFIEAALFADTPEDAQDAILAPETESAMLDFAGVFYDTYWDHINAYSGGLGQAGHDLWFTMNGHGCGFWENEGESAADALDAAAKAAGHSEGLYLGDDGLLYWARTC